MTAARMTASAAEMTQLLRATVEREEYLAWVRALTAPGGRGIDHDAAPDAQRTEDR